jgi:predicted kinase
MGYIIVDIDGTLASVDHRRHYLDGRSPNWGAFFNAMDRDAPIVTVVNLVDMLYRYNDVAIVLCSGRPDTHKAMTEAWLADHGVRYDDLLMRKGGDNRSDVVVKREMLSELRNHYGADPMVVIDDRQSVVDMWRSEGIVCLQAAPGDFDRPKFKPGVLAMFVGPSHAGKTHTSRRAELSGIWISQDVVSSDSIREQLTGDANDMSRNGQVFAALHAIVKARIESGLDTVVDATNIRTKDRLAVVDCAPPSTRVMYIVCDRPLDAKLASLRPGFPEDVVRRHHQTFQSNLKAILAGDGRPNVEVLDARETS